MIRVKFIYTDDFKIEGFEFRGHADYDEFGYDIVCAAATSNAIAVINSLESLQNVSFEKMEAKEGYICAIIKQDCLDRSQLLLEHLKLAIEQISSEYPKNIKIFEK